MRRPLGALVDPTIPYVGTRALFEKAGFRKGIASSSVVDGFPRVLLRREPR